MHTCRALIPVKVQEVQSCKLLIITDNSKYKIKEVYTFKQTLL